MKKSISILTVFIILCVKLSAQENTLAILSMAAGDVDKYISQGVTGILKTELHNSGCFNIIGQSEIDRVLKENKEVSLCNEIECGVRIGKLLNVNMVLIGSVIKLGDSLLISGTLIDVNSANTMLLIKVKAVNLNQLDAATEEFAGKIINKMGGRISTPEKKYIVRKESIKNNRLGYVIDVNSKSIKMDIGFYENVKKRYIYEIRDGYKRIAWCVVRKINENESECEIIKIFKNSEIIRGQKTFYIGREKRGGIIIFNGIGTSIGSFNNFPKYSFEPAIHLDIGFDIILKFGLGFQFNISDISFNHSIYINELKRSYLRFNCHYVCPFFLKYNFLKNSSASPYIGVGVAVARYQISEYIEDVYNYMNNNYLVSYWAVPVLNYGFNFFSIRRLNFTVDFRYYFGLGAPTINNKKITASALVLSLGFHISL